MSTLLPSESITRLQQNEARLDKLANGADTETWQTREGATLPTIAKFLVDKGIEIDANVAEQVVGLIGDQIEAINTNTASALNSKNAAADSETAAAISEANALVYSNTVGPFARTFNTRAALTSNGVSGIAVNAYALVMADESRGGNRTIYQNQSGTMVYIRGAGLDIDDSMTPSTAAAVPVRIREILERTAVPEWYGTAAALATDAYPALQALIDATEVGRTIFLKGITYNLSQGLNLKGRKLKGQGGLTRLKMLATATSARQSVVRMVGADADYSCVEDVILDGNRSGRELGGAFSTTEHGTHGVVIQDARFCLVKNCPVKDIGGIASADPALSQWAGYQIERSDSATADVYGNLIEGADLDDPLQRASFCVRFRTAFDNFAPGQQGYKLYGNRVNGFRSVGVGKNVCEMVGPDTIFNVIENGQVFKAGGDTVLDCDFGASDNIYRSVIVRDMQPVVGRTSFVICRAGTTDKRGSVAGYTMKYSQRNLYEDITWGDTVVARDNFFARFFHDVGGIDNRVVRGKVLPSVTKTGTGGALVGLQIDTIPDLTTGESETVGLTLIDCYFRGVEQAVRGTATRVTRLTIDNPDFECSGAAVFSTSGMIWEGFRIKGGRIQGSTILSITQLSRHWFNGVNFISTSNSTPITLGSGASARAGSIKDCRLQSTGTPTVFITRSLEDEEIDENFLDGVGINTALFASTGGRGQFSRNHATGLTSATQKRNFPARVKGTTAPLSGLWGPNDEVENTTPAVGQPAVWKNTNLSLVSGAVSAPWTSGQSYTVGTWVSNGGRAYSLVTAGGGTVANAPTHTSGDVTGADGYVWRWQSDAVATFQAVGEVRHAVALYGSATLDPANLASGAFQTVGTITVTGARVGDAVTLSPPTTYSGGVQGTRLWADVTADDTVTVYQQNPTAGAINLAGGTYRVKVERFY